MSVPMNSAKLPIPTRHDRLTSEQVVDFAAWMDSQLVDLELRFAGFMTTQSVKVGSDAANGVSRGASKPWNAA